MIREAILETLHEVLEIPTDDGTANTASSDQKDQAQDETNNGNSVKFVKKGDPVSEMARIAKGYRLVNPEVDAEPFRAKTVSGVNIGDVVDYFREHPGTEKKDIQNHFQFVRPQIANAIVNALKDAGVLTKVGADGEPENVGVGDVEDAGGLDPTDVEDLFVGNAENPLSIYFGDENHPEDELEPGADATVPLEEPVPGPALEPAPTGIPNSMADNDYDTAEKYSELKQRLVNVKTNLFNVKRKRTSSDDLQDTPSTEISRLETLKATLEKRIGDLVQSSPYLQNKLGKGAGAAVKTIDEPIELEPEEDEESNITEQYRLRKLQYYAGIIK